MPPASTAGHAATEALFTLELQYRPDAGPLTDGATGPLGTYLGSGTGRLRDGRVDGTVRWDLYEDTDPSGCDMAFRGVIETTDGARVEFGSLGHGVARPGDGPRTWDITASVHFSSPDPRYGWLTERPATWHGRFDEGTGEHRYEVIRHA